jgi:hypothetical protein
VVRIHSPRPFFSIFPLSTLRMLRPVRIDLNWIDCTSRLLSGYYRPPRVQTI